MKMKTTFFVALLFTVVSVNAQVYSDDFESSTDVPSGWKAENFTGSANTTLSINTASELTGVNSLEFDITANVGDWFANIAGYSFPATIADEYNITFDAKASADISIPAKLNTDGNDGQTEIISETLNLTTASQHFTLSTTSGCTMTKNYLFWLELNNQSVGTAIYIDNFSLSKKGTTGINDVSKININYFPNPAKDFVLINGKKEGDAVAIYSLDGQLVLSSVIDGKPLSLKNINTGAYLLKVGDTTQKLIIKK